MRFFKFIAGSRLRNKFAVFFIVLAVSPLLILGSLTLYLIDISHRQDVSNLGLQLIDQKIEEVEKFFADTLGILELRVGFTQKSDIELSQQNFLLEGLLEENRSFDEVSFINLTGKETAKKFRSGGEIELIDVSLLGKFKTSVSGEDYIGSVYYTLSGPRITLSAPVKNRNDDIIQVLSAEVNLGEISRAVELARLGSSGYIILVDKNGDLIASREKGLSVGANLSGIDRIKSVLSGQIFDALGQKDRYFSFMNARPVVGAAKRVPKIGWGALVEWPLSDADALIKDVRNQVLTLTLISVLAVLFLAPIFALRLLRPIHDLETGAAEVEKGNFEHKVEITTKDELEDLGTAFNKMLQGLKRLQELKNEFVFIAAHELRAPVTAVKGYVSMLLEGDAGALPSKAIEFLKPVNQANERLIGLVNDILEIARSEAGRLKIEVSATDIGPLIKATVLELKPLADEKKIGLVYEEFQKPAIALTDNDRFKEILTNLISNAVKYNHEKGWVKVANEAGDNSIITHVEDNGFGMSEEDQKHIFEKFFRAETGKVKEITGTGLGLFITKELVEKMGGRIWFQSNPGHGSKFSFSLPNPQ